MPLILWLLAAALLVKSAWALAGARAVLRDVENANSGGAFE